MYKIYLASFRTGRNGYDNFIVAKDAETAEKLAKRNNTFVYDKFSIRRSKAIDLSD